MSHSDDKSDNKGKKKKKKGGGDEGEDGYSQEAYLASLETRLPGGRKTKRLPLLKLELGDNGSHAQMSVISSKLFQMADPPPLEPSREIQNWIEIDKKLFGDAKAAYDGVLAPFKKQPRVYKLESIREKVWEGTMDRSAEIAAKEAADADARLAKLAERKAKMAEKKMKKMKDATSESGQMTEAQKAAIEAAEAAAKLLLEDVPVQLPPLTIDESLETYLDPFEPPYPWKKEMYKGELTYINDDTKERIKERPNVKWPGDEKLEVWREKMQMLEQLTPREDLNGYEYRETDLERRRRQRAMADFEEAMKVEIRRREDNPTDVEIIEDCLFDMVDTITKRLEKEEKNVKKAEKAALVQTWIPLCRPYRMKPLPGVENEDGEIEREVTDLDFTDMIISETGHMLALTTPPGFFQKHEKERSEAQEKENERLRLEEYERNRPFVDKARIIIALARNDPNEAATRVYRGFKDRIFAPLRWVAKKDNRQKAIRESKRMVIDGLLGLLKATQTPKSSAIYIKNRLHEFYQRTFVLDEEQDAHNAELDALLNELSGEKKKVEVDPNAETEAQKARRLWREKQPLPAKHADCVLVTMTFLIEPPPPWKWKKPRTWKDDAADAREKAREQASDAKWAVLPKIPPIVDKANDVLAKLGRDAIELVEEDYEVPYEVLKRKATIRHPWEVRDRDEQSNATAPEKKPSKWGAKLLGLDFVEAEGVQANSLKQPETAPAQAKSAGGVSKVPKTIDSVAETGNAAGKQPNGAADAADDKKTKRKKKTEAESKGGDKALKAGKESIPEPPVPTEAVVVPFRYKTQAEALEDERALIVAQREAEALKRQEEEEKRRVDRNSIMNASNIYRKGLNISDEERQEAYLQTLRAKALEENPEAYNRFSVKVPALEKVLSIPTAQELKDKLRNRIRKNLEPEFVKDIMDPTEMNNFKDLLLHEISNAICLPRKNISIEEIRRLEKNSPKLVALKRRNDEFAAELKRKNDEAEEERLAERERRKQLHNPANYGEENWAVENLRDFVEDLAERHGRNPEETVRKLGLSKEQLRLKRYDRMKLTEEGEFIRENPSDTMLATQGSRRLGTVDFDLEHLADLERTRCSEFRSTLFSTKFSTYRSTNPKEIEEKERAEADFRIIFDVYEDICDKIQVAEDDAKAAKEEVLRQEKEEARHLSMKQQYLMVFSEEPYLVDLMWDMSAEVLRRDGEVKAEARELKDMYRSMLESMHPGEHELIDSFQELLDNVTLKVEYDLQQEKEEVERRKQQELFDFNNEFNWTVHENPREARLIKRIQATAARKNVEPQKPSFFKLGIANPSDLVDDPKYWLGKTLKPLTVIEKRRRRMKVLHDRQIESLEGIELALKKLRDIRSDMEYDAQWKYDEDYEPIIEGILKPWSKAFKLRVKHKAKVYAQKMRTAFDNKKKLLMNFLYPFKPLTDEVVASKVETIKANYFKEEREKRRAEREAKRWKENISDEEKLRRENLRASLLQMYIGVDGVQHATTIVNCYENMCRAVAQRLEGWPDEEGSDNEGNEKDSDVFEGKADGNTSNRIEQESNIDAAVDALQAELSSERLAQEKLAAFEAAQAKKDAKVDPRIAEKEMHAKFRRLNRRRKRMYDSSVVDVLDKVCIAVDLAEEYGEPAEELYPQVEDDYDLEPGKADTVSEAEVSDDDANEGVADNAAVEEGTTEETPEGIKEPPPPLYDDSLRGCEISFLIYINDEDRYGAEVLKSLEAEDIGVALQDQAVDAKSRLRSGYIGRTCMDVTYKMPFQKRLFDTWTSFWVHIIHPTFFHYSTGKPKKADKSKTNERLASGLLIHNPTSEFNAREKDTFLMLSRKYQKKPMAPRAAKAGKGGEVLDPVAVARLKQMEEKAKKKAAQSKSVVNLEVDEFAGDVKKLQILRPNMEKINSSVVERMRRIAKAFDEKYQLEMMAGLEQPGNRLSNTQYQALKDRDAAARIYRSAKGKLAMNNRKAGITDDDPLPMLHPTHIPDETFAEWLMEIRNEDEEKMRQRGILKLQQKELRNQESELRLRFAKQRYWVINYMTYAVEDSAELGPVIHRELMEENERKQKALNNDMPEQELRKFETRRNEFQSFIIQEEKATRKLFASIAKWAWKIDILGARKAKKRAKRATVMKAVLPAPSNDNEDADDPDEESSQIIPTGIVHISDMLPDKDEETLDGTVDSSTIASKEANMFGNQLPFLHRDKVMNFMNIFRIYRDHAKIRNAVVIKVFENKKDRHDQIRREGAMVVAQAESLVHLGKTKKEIDKVVAVWSEEKEAETKKLFAEWDATIPPIAPPNLKLDNRLDEIYLQDAYDCHWIDVALENKLFLDALSLLPSKDEGIFARDEIIQFATITAEVAPLLLRCQARLRREQEERAAAMGLRVKQDTKSTELASSGISRKELREKQRLEKLAEREAHMPAMSAEAREAMIAKKQAAMLADGLGAEAVRRMKRMEDAKRRQGEREQAWLKAHPHRFIKYNDIDPAFCITCVEKLYERWLEEHSKEEKEHADHFETEIIENYEDIEPDVTAQLAKEAKERLEDIKKDVLALYEWEDKKVEDEARFRDQEAEYQAALKVYKQKGAKAPIKPVKRLRAPPDRSATRIFADRRFAVTDAPPEFVSYAIHRAKLSLVDPDGKSILTEDTAGGELVEEEDDDDEATDDQDNDEAFKEEKPLGLKFRVWDKSIEGTGKGVFLGQLVMNTDSLLRPPSGIRTFPLKTDRKITEAAVINVDKIQGSITILIKTTKKDKVTGDPCRWRIEVVRCNRLAVADRLKLTSPFVEVYWCGPGIRDGTQIDFKRWLACGETVHKNKNFDPIFDPKTDNSAFEFPPMWTDMDIPDRGMYVNGARQDLEGGAWCAQNQLPPPPKLKGWGSFGKLKRIFRRAATVAIACVKFLKGPKMALRNAVLLKLDTLRELWRAENRERLCMAREERRNRKFELEVEKKRARPYLERQIGFEREWSNLCRNIQDMPKILARLRFMMGAAADGGGIVIMTEDPATKRMLNVLSVPILYPEDEGFLTGQMSKLIGKQHKNLVGIVDFSVHAARVYNLNGFSGVDERMALAVLERYEGVNMLDYMKKEWLHMSNDRFRALLKQIIDGLVGLHEEDIIHRNFHSKAVIVRLPKNIQAEDLHPDKSKRFLPKEPNLRISEYWFLQNPRKQGCEYSLGRADWGSRETAPPESLGGHLISDRSDVWAFGVCLYFWATGGRTLPGAFKIDDLASHIPLKWGTWVHALLRMCLAQNPKVRASAKDIQKFLLKIYGN